MRKTIQSQAGGLVDTSVMILRFTFPYILLLICFQLDVFVHKLPVLEVSAPSFMLMGIYYWSVYRPTLLPDWMVFLLGALKDFIVGIPIGFSSLLFVSVNWGVRAQRRFLYGQSFAMLWLGYTLISLFHALILLITSFFMHGSEMVMFDWKMMLCGIILFPFFWIAFYATHKALPDSSEDLIR